MSGDVAGIRVVTDSTADLTTEVIDQYGIVVVPLSVTIADQTVPDGTYTQQEFFDRMNAAPSLPTTSQPSVGAFVETYEGLLRTAREVVSVHISSHLSGTVESAREAAKQFDGRVHVIDSLNLSWGLAFQVIEASRAVSAGDKIADVISRLERVRDRVQMIVGVDNLENLAKGGRIGKVTAFLGGLLNLRVTFCVREGVFQPVGRARGAHAVMQQSIDWVTEQMGDHRRAAFCIMHALSPDKAEWLKGEIEKRFDVAEMHVAEVGTVIATHTGRAFGVALLPLD